MNQPSSELIKLLQAWQADRLSDRDAARLEALIAEDESARRYYIQYMSMCASLRRYLVGAAPSIDSIVPTARPAGMAPPIDADLEAMALAASQAIDDVDETAAPWKEDKPGVIARISDWLMRPLPQALLATAALIVVVVSVLATVLSMHFVPPSPIPPAFVARITADVNAVWDRPGADRSWRVGDWLPRGRVRLAEGHAEITFDSGARITLEGPAELDLSSAADAHLQQGKLVAEVPEQAVGFTVTSPATRVIDLGTAFAMQVDPDGRSEVHVLEGVVEAESSRGDSDRRRLVAHQALRFKNLPSSPIESISADASRFVRGLPRPEMDAYRFVRWSFDESDGATARDSGLGYAQGPFHAKLTRHGTDAAATGPIRVPGKFGRGVYLDGHGAYVQTPFPGIGGDAPRTIAMWVRVPADGKLSEALSLICWGSFDHPGAAWQVSWNAFEKDGPIGPLRIGTLEGQSIATTDLRDGRWHHVAVVFAGGPGADIATHGRLYVDGRLEADSRNHPQKVDTDVTGPQARRARMGFNLVDRGFFRGDLDEVYVFDIALTPEQVVRLMHENQVP